MCSLLHHHPRFCFLFISFVSHLVLFILFYIQRPIPCSTLPLHHHYTSHYQFNFLHYLFIDIIFTLGLLRSMARAIFYTCCISYMRAWVLTIGYLSIVSLHFYHPSLHYILCLKTTLRPWNQMSSLIAILRHISFVG